MFTHKVYHHYGKVKVGNDQEIALSVRKTYSEKTEVGKQ